MHISCYNMVTKQHCVQNIIHGLPIPIDCPLIYKFWLNLYNRKNSSILVK